MKKRPNPSLLYFTELDTSLDNGYTWKILGQLRAMRNAGFTTTLVSPSGRRVRGVTVNDSQFSTDSLRRSGADRLSPVGRLLLRLRLVAEATRVIIRGGHRLVYVRRVAPATPSVVGWLLLLRLFRVSVMYEYPTYPYSEENRKLPASFRVIDMIGSLFVDLIVSKLCVVPTQVLPPNSSHIQISNGVNVSDFPLRVPAVHGQLTLVGVAYLQRWHGYDRIIAGMAEDTQRNVGFEVVGSGPALEELKAQAARLGVSSRVIFHGAVVGRRLDAIFDRSDIAVGSLGFHRIGANMGSPMKSREYCCRGIPQVIGYRDQTVIGDFVFQVPPSDDPVSMEELRTFISDLKSIATDIRAFASSNLSWGAAMSPALRWAQKQSRSNH